MKRFLIAAACPILPFTSPSATLPDKNIRLNEVTVSAHKQQVLHTIGYLREYSELTTGGDTVFMFREKWVDFMTPSNNVKRFTGWHTPRILSSKSYYRFIDSAGTDSVSDRFNQHFSWSDWIRIPSRIPIPGNLNKPFSTDTIAGKYRPKEIWLRNDDQVDLKVNVLAHPDSRRWVPGLNDFFARGVDFERFDINYYFRAVSGRTITESNLEMMTFNIESNGRGRNMFKFNRPSEPFSVRTYAELYIAGRENLSVSEARHLEQKRPEADMLQAMIPDNIPELSSDIARLICRVDSIDHTGLRVKAKPDENLAGLSLKPLSPKEKMINRLRGMVGLPRKGIRAEKYDR
ncbi:MAG: hypothetical protein K2O38_05940 [Muribaculaceae bacterium]|nr:hypothetical protein [Muribaculaceae bacterium]